PVDRTATLNRSYVGSRYGTRSCWILRVSAPAERIERNQAEPATARSSCVQRQGRPARQHVFLFGLCNRPAGEREQTFGGSIGAGSEVRQRNRYSVISTQ